MTNRQLFWLLYFLFLPLLTVVSAALLTLAWKYIVCDLFVGVREMKLWQACLITLLPASRNTATSVKETILEMAK